MNSTETPLTGWPALLAEPAPFRGEGRFPIPAYSEFMPAPWVGRKPYGAADPTSHDPSDPHGFLISEYQQAHQLRPGLRRIANHLAGVVDKLVAGQRVFSKALTTDNLYWPEALVDRVRLPAREPFLWLLPLALSRTLDDKGRVRWTLFGSSEEGPARPFWQSFYTAPGVERPESESLALLNRLLDQSLGLARDSISELVRAGFRILPMGEDPDFPHWGREPLPRFTRPLLLAPGEPLGAVKALLTFRPYALLPEAVRNAWLGGALQLLPFPGSLVFFGHRGYRKLARELPSAMQIPLLHLFPGNAAAPAGMRIAQSGWLDEPRPRGEREEPESINDQDHHHGPIVNHVKRTHRWNRSHRDEDETASMAALDRVTHALFSANPDDMGLYDKPMARNAQIWTEDHRLLLDGPRAGRGAIDEARWTVERGGHFGYRFHYPPMRAARHEILWHLPLCAFRPKGQSEPTLIELNQGPTGYLTARPWASPSLQNAIELWPRLLERAPHVDAAELFERDPGHRLFQTSYNARKLLEAHALLGDEPLSPSYARRLLTTSRSRTLDGFLEQAAATASDPMRGRALVTVLENMIDKKEPHSSSDPKVDIPASFTFEKTATREFEERYWKRIAFLAEGEFRDKDNADFCGENREQQAPHDLARLGDWLKDQYRRMIDEHGMSRRAVVGDHRFRWQTDFDFPWMGGWAANQTGKASERNIVMVIPGNDRSQAVVMADHYDTAYMEDVYEKARGGDLTRKAAAGADDNHSATAALLMAAQTLLPMAKAGQLKYDVWLIHLTGEEFPSDCLGARNLVQRLVEGNFALLSDEHGRVELPARVRGAFVLDMVAHNSDHDRYVFQIAPGEGAASARMSRVAHEANERWNRSAPHWNHHSPLRLLPGPSPRMDSGARVPHPVACPQLEGEIRPQWHFKSSLYNTDGQIFSDAGIPVVLFMENYDINRSGYHDTQDTMANIDLDYAAALVAIAIESVAALASGEG